MRAWWTGLMLAGCPGDDPDVTTDLVALGDAITTDEDLPAQFRLEGEGAALFEFAVVTPPSHGTLDLVGGNATYTPEPDWNGDDSFTFTVSADGATSAPATVEIAVTPVNDAPRADARQLAALVGDRVSVAVVAVDPEGDLVEVTFASDDPDVALSGSTFRVPHVGTIVVDAILSDGTDTREVPITVSASDVAAGDSHMVAARPDGTVWSWGNNDAGQLGDGGEEPRGIPAPVCRSDADALPPCDDPLDGVLAVAAGESFSLALLADGTVVGWGSNEDRQLGVCGEACLAAHPLPVAIAGLTDVVAIDAGGSFGLALRADGQVWTWGLDTNGQLGRGTAGDADGAPAAVCLDAACAARLDDVVAISGGRDSGAAAAAVTVDGRVYTWGDGDDGLLGDGCVEAETCAPRAFAGPVCVAGSGSGCTRLETVVDVAMGEGSAVALLADGGVVTWGDGAEGELGAGCDPEDDGPNACFDRGIAAAACAPGDTAPCAPLTGVVSIGAGEDHAAAALADGRVVAWGENASGQLGNGCGGDDSCAYDVGTPAPACDVGEVAPCDGALTGVVGVRASGDMTFALAADGALLAWGDNDDGNIGDGTMPAASAVPVGQFDVESISAGDAHSLAVTSDGHLWAWGSTLSLATLPCDGCEMWRAPTEVPRNGAFDADWSAVAAGFEHSVALKSDGALYAWGLAPGAGPEDTDPPTRVGTGLYQAIAAGDAFTLAVAQDGGLWAWGSGVYGQLGDGAELDRDAPVRVLGPEGSAATADWADVAAGRRFALARKANGSLWAFGDNGYGNLGNLGYDDASVPVPVYGPEGSTPPTDWTRATAGDRFALARRVGGTLWAWGDSNNGVLGDDCETRDDCFDWAAPVEILAPNGISHDTDWSDLFDAGGQTSVAVKDDGSVWAWGEDNDGSLGVGFRGDVGVPTAVCARFDAATWTCAERLTDIVALSVGRSHTLALGADGVLWAWGANDEGQLGVGGPDVVTPALVRW